MSDISKKLKEATALSMSDTMQVQREDWLSSGSRLINLACSGLSYGAFCKGKYFWIVGESSSGKTFLTLGVLAEAARNKSFDDYDLIFDNAEDGALMDMDRYFGHQLAERLQPPAVDEDGEPIYSRLTEEFYFNLDDRLIQVEKGKAKPFIYLLDSMDSLGTKCAREKFKENKTATRKGTKPKGDYGDGKAKINSTWIRDITSRIRDTNSILIVLSQERDKMDATMFDPEKAVVAGGRALKFYASFQLWLAVGRTLYKNVNGNRRQTGIICRTSIRKNRLSGKQWSVEVPIHWSYGIDDIGSMVDFLVKEKKWKRGKSDEGDSGPITAEDFGFVGPREELIDLIETGGKPMELSLVDLVEEVWKDIEVQCTLDRKPKYD